LTFALAVRPVRQLALARSRAWLLAVPFFFGLVAVGVYLGLVVRYNSWDLLTRPAQVLATASEIADRPRLASAILLLGLTLWVTYELADIWIDGLAHRLSRWRRVSAPVSS